MGAMWVYVTEVTSRRSIVNAYFGGPQGLTVEHHGEGGYYLQNIYPDQPFWVDSECHRRAYLSSNGYVREDSSGSLRVSLVKDGSWPDCP